MKVLFFASPPMYVVVNPANGHAQYGYALAAPVCLTEAARRKPLAYLAAIEYAYNRRLEADRAFHGPLAKNPLHPSWHLWQPANDPTYELNELAEYVDLPNQATALRIRRPCVPKSTTWWNSSKSRQSSALSVG